MVGIAVGAEGQPGVEGSLPARVQVMLLHKVLQIGRAEVFPPLPEGVVEIEVIQAELVWHDDHTIIRHALCNPVMAADGFQPPHLVLVGEGHAVGLIGAVLLQQRTHPQHTLPGGVDVGQHHRHQILLAQAAGHLLPAALPGLIDHIGVRAQHPGIGGDGLGGGHGHIGGVDAAGRPHAMGLGHIGRGRVPQGSIRQLHGQVGNHGLVGFPWLSGIHHKELLGLKATVVIAGNQRGAVMGGQLAGQNRRTGHQVSFLLCRFTCSCVPSPGQTGRLPRRYE